MFRIGTQGRPQDLHLLELSLSLVQTFGTDQEVVLTHVFRIACSADANFLNVMVG